MDEYILALQIGASLFFVFLYGYSVNKKFF